MNNLRSPVYVFFLLADKFPVGALVALEGIVCSAVCCGRCRCAELIRCTFFIYSMFLERVMSLFFLYFPLAMLWLKRISLNTVH